MPILTLPNGKSSKITWGADPEFLLVDRLTDMLVPAFEVKGLGTKGKPTPLIDRPEVGVLADGVSLELNVFRPVSSSYRLWELINRGLYAFCNQFQAYYTSDKNSATWSGKTLEHPQFMTLGCDPDQDAYAQGAPRPAVKPEDFEFTKAGIKQAARFAGGHIHIGIDPWPNIPKHVFVQVLDCIYFSCFNKGSYVNNGMAATYRKAGLYRDKPYGVEYRTPNTSWTKSQGLFTNFTSMVEGFVANVTDPDSLEFESAVRTFREVSSLPRYQHPFNLPAREAAEMLSPLFTGLPSGTLVEINKEDPLEHAPDDEIEFPEVQEFVDRDQEDRVQVLLQRARGDVALRGNGDRIDRMIREMNQEAVPDLEEILRGQDQQAQRNRANG